MSDPRSQADAQLLEKLLLGQLPVEEADRLAAELGSDPRLEELAQSVGGKDTLLDSLRQHQTVDDSSTDQLVARLLKRLKSASPSAAGETATLGLDPAAPAGEPIPESLEYFHIEKVLGQGGMGTVYLANDTRLGRPVALKTLKRELAANPAAKDRFLREARSAARLHHDHVIPIYYVGEADGIPFLAMPFLEGEPLDRRLQHEQEALSIPEAIRIAREVALGLAVAHKQGLVHRDIKPANIWLESPNGRVKILDFGLARSQNEGAQLTASGAIMGTPAYMAPEQARGKQVDSRADLFSLGCVLYEMLTGQRPFRGDDTMAILSSLALDNPTPPHTLNTKCPPALSELTMQLLAKEPSQRAGPADALAKDLAKFEALVETPNTDPWSHIDDANVDVPLATPAEPEASERVKSSERRVLPYVTIAIGLALIGLGIIFSGTIIRVANNEGELIVEVDDPNTEVVVKDGDVEIRREENGKKRVFLVKAGRNGEIEVRDPGSETVLVTKEFKVRRGGHEVVKVTTGMLAAARKLSGPSIATHSRIGIDRRVAFARGDWSIGGNVIEHSTKGKQAMLLFGGPDFADGDFTCEIQRDDSGHGVALLARATDLDNYYYFEIGSFNNQFHSIYSKEAGANWRRIDQKKAEPTPSDRWIPVRLKLRGDQFEAFVDDKLVLSGKDDRRGKGYIGLRTWNESGKYRNLKFTAPDGKILWEGLPELGPSPRYKNTLGMEFALIPKGKAWLGGGSGNLGDKEVEFKEDFYLGVYEVTQEEWEKLTGMNPSHFSRTGFGKDLIKDIADADLKRFPVENVSWHEAQAFLEALNKRDNQSGWIYRLPTEWEWEYACRGGPMALKMDSAFSFYLSKPSNTLSPDDANHDGVLGRTRKVGSYQPNRLGLHDMHGNVLEWCADELTDAKGISVRTLRGGGYGKPGGAYCRASYRSEHPPFHKHSYRGLRVARVRAGNPPRYKNSVGMEFALVPKGKAWLGGGGGKTGYREVEFRDDFYIGVYSVTQEEWEKLTGANAAHYSRNGFRKEAVKDISDDDLKRFPVEGVSYADVQAFLAKLNERDEQAGWEYRLPTSDEWEIACRGGPMTDQAESAFHFYAGKPSNELPPEKCNYAYKGGPNRTVKVGQFDANKLGIFDMHGNVLEWCSDAGKDPMWGDFRVARGGSWNDPRFGAAQVLKFSPTVRYPSLGFRVVRARTSSGSAPAIATAPFDEKKAKDHQDAWAKHLNRKVVEPNSLDMKMKLVPPGNFRMGNSETPDKVHKDWAGNDDERPAHEVAITRPFLMSATEVSQEQFEKIMGRNISGYSARGVRSAQVKDVETTTLPVEMVTWFDAIEFCNNLSEKEGLPPYYELKFPVRHKDGGITVADVKILGGLGYRLPTEAEWEYACRSGTSGRYSFEFDYGTLGQYGWFGYIDRPHAVGERKPNAFGLCDMHGNVHEWCYDWLGQYAADSLRDPTGPATGTERVNRGGAYNFLPQYARSAWRGRAKPGSRYDNIGFRVTRFVTDAGIRPASDPERRAAEWLLQDRGPKHRPLLMVKTGGQSLRVGSIDKIPNGPLEVLQINVAGIDKQDSAVAIDMISRLPTEDIGLYHSPGLGDDLFQSLARNPGFQNLRVLHLNTIGVTDKGLAEIAKFSKLTNLSIGLAPLSAKELALYRNLPLTDLEIFICKNVDDGAMAEIAAYPCLKRLSLAEVTLSDKALEHLAKCKSLEQLIFFRIKFSEEARRKLTAALPQCKVQWGDAADRRAAEWVLSMGGFVDIRENGKMRKIRAGEKLPEGDFELTSVDVRGQKVTDEGVAVFNGCKNLTYLIVQSPRVTDVGLANFKECTRLDYLNLESTGITVKGLAAFEKNDSLKGLVLLNTPIGDESIERLSAFKKLSGIDVRLTRITEAGSKKLIAALPQCKVEWQASKK